MLLLPTNDLVRWSYFCIILVTTSLLTGSVSSATILILDDIVNQTGHDLAAHRDALSDSRSPHLDGPEYSVFMHHSSGLVLVMIALLLTVDRLRLCPHAFITIFIGCTWLFFGIFLFIKSDPDEWPISLGFMESFNKPATASEWIQHKVLSLIPMLLGAYTLLARSGGQGTTWTIAVAGATLLGGLGLLIHQHFDHPDFDMVNFQHRLFAASGMFVAGGLLMERWGTITWRGKPFVVPLGILLLGLQLALYVE